MTSVHNWIFTSWWNRPFGEETCRNDWFLWWTQPLFLPSPRFRTWWHCFLVLLPFQCCSVAPSCDDHQTFIYHKTHKKIKSPRYSLDMSATVQFQWCLLILKFFQLKRVTFAHYVYSVDLELLWNGNHGSLKLLQYHQKFLKRKVAWIYPTIIPSRLMCLGHSALETVALWFIATCYSCSSTSAQPFITCPL